MKRTGVLTGLALGLAAGAAGTAALTAPEGKAYADGKGGESFKEPRTWAEAAAPAQFAKRMLGPRIWPYPARQLATDWAYHAVYGLGVAGAFETLDR